MRRSFEGKRHQPAKSEEKRKRCDRKHRGFGFFCAFLLCAGLISGGAAVSGESGAQEAVNAEAPADDAVQPEVPAQPVEEAQQNTPAPEDTEGGGEAGQQQEETPDQQQEELYPEDDGNGEESVPSVSRPDAGSAESSAAPVGTTAEPLTVSVTTAMKYAFAGENVLTFETQITGGTEPFETSCEIDRDGTPVWSSQEYQPEVTYMPEEAGGYELVLSVTDAAGQAASGRCAIPVAVRHEESPSDWEPALKEVRMTGRYAEDLLAIARTQLGYTESADNFIVTEEGARQGYTRYGQWQGDAYEPWDAAFAAFCLYYAGVRDVPADTKAEKWADELKRRGMYRDLTAENRPEEGDFLFTRDGEVTRIGLVEKTDDTGVTAIEGDVGGAVARVTYGWDDARLAGFGDPRTTLTDEAAGVTVTGIFPEGATLTVQLLAEDADGFTEAQDRIHAALSPLYDRYAVNLADVTETAVYVPSLTENGEAVSPCKKVRVGVSACGGRFAGHGDVRVLTFSDEQTELLSAEEKDGGDGADAIVSASFRTDRLSEFALTAVAPDRLTMRRTAADGDAKVTVTYGAGAGVPESAELRVRQIRGDGDDADRAEYQKRQAEAAALLETEAGGENAASQPDTAASGSPGNAENADVSRQTDQNAENAAADQQADQNAENAAADQTEDSKEYAAYMEEVEAALASGRKVQMAKLFDITILDKEGNEVEPLNPVRANIEFVPKEVQEGTDLELYQFQTEGEKPQVMENVEVLTDDDNIVNGIEFETDGFSVYGIVGTVIEKNVLASDGKNYKVTVTYGAETGIPEGAELEVEEILPGENGDASTSSAYDEYVSKTENALGMEEGSAGYIRLFDIKIVDKDDHEIKYQPAEGTAVDVCIELADNESEELSVVHFADGAEEGDKVDAETDGQVVMFEANGFSVYAVFGTTIEKTVLARNGRNYRITVTYGPEAKIPDDADLSVEEILPAEDLEDGETDLWQEYVFMVDSALGWEDQMASYIRLFDIKIVKKGDSEIKYQPAEGTTVDVKIELADKETSEEAVANTQVVHIADGAENGDVIDSLAVEGNELRFAAEGFSAYAIVEGPAAVELGWTKVAGVADLDETGFYIGHTGGYYFMDELVDDGSRIGIRKTKPASGNPPTTGNQVAALYYFERVSGTENQFYIYCKDGETKKYVAADTSSKSLLYANQEAVRTAFTVTRNNDGSFYIKTPDNWYWNMQGGTGGARFCVWNVANADGKLNIWNQLSEVTADPYGLDDSTYGLLFWDESLYGKAMMTSSGNANALDAKALMVLATADNKKQLFVPNDSDISMWTFHWYHDDYYYLTASVDGSTKYLKIGTNGLSLVDSESEASQIQVVPGTGAHAGQICLKVGNTTLTYSGAAETGFSTGGIVGSEWLNLVEPSELTSDYLKTYSASKVSVSDENITTGSKVIVYTRAWNEEAHKYEYFAIDHDGTLVPCYENGDSIEWVGNIINTMLWQFTEYEDNGAPNYFYELYNEYEQKYLAPQVTGGQIISDSPVGINMNGRRYGQYYSNILAWDADNYSYAGLKVENGQIVSCPKAEAMDFYFAVMQDVPVDDALTTVKTVDHTQYGITMKVVDFNSKVASHDGSPTTEEQDSVMGYSGFSEWKAQGGMLSTNLGEDGYPTATNTGKSLSQLFQNGKEKEVNHLFIQSTFNASGYYEFDSAQNFASLNGAAGGTYTSDFTGDFTVYKQIGTYDTTAKNTLKHGQFLPFNNIEAGRFASVNKQNLYSTVAALLPDTDPRKYENLYLVKDPASADLYFGVELEASFTQTPSGLDDWGHDIIFEFTGDDDFWLYVDGELVIDLGGIHSALPGSVNFRTGDVYINGDHTTLLDLFRENYKKRNPITSDNDPVLIAHLKKYFDYDETTQTFSPIFRDYSTHKMNIFYMERGGGASNLHMRFNLASVKPGTVELSKELAGVDESETHMAEFAYQIKYKKKDGTEHLLTNGVPGVDDPNDYVFYKNTTNPVTFDTYKEIGGIRYDNVFTVKPGETVVINFPTFGMDHEEIESYSVIECGVNTAVYENVSVNGTALEGVSVSGADNRKDYGIDYQSTDARPRVNYVNTVNPDAMRTLTFSKKLYDADGKTPITKDSTTFDFRLYFGTESDPDPALANMYTYHVKDKDGYYCRWDAANQRFEKIESGITDYDSLSEEQKTAASFSTSMNGAISRIPVDYTVEVRQILAGTKYKVQERSWEMPDGYSFQKYVYYDDYDLSGGDPPAPTQIYSGDDSDSVADAGAPDSTSHEGTYYNVIETNKDPHVDVCNLKGWGLRVNKVWTDADYMKGRDTAYFAVFTPHNENAQGHGQGLWDYVDDTLYAMPYGTTTLYWYWLRLPVNVSFDDYAVYEVEIKNAHPVPVTDENGKVTNADPEHFQWVGEGEALTLNGTQKGETVPAAFTYSVHYTKGEISAETNVRVDTVTNDRPGIILKKEDWNGKALAGATFTLTEAGSDVPIGTFTSDAEGNITTAFLSENKDYTLTETVAPQGYHGLEKDMTIRIDGSNHGNEAGANGSTVEVSGVDGAYYTLTQASGTTPAELVIKNRPYMLQAIKQDGDTEIKLEGVHFELHKQVTVDGVTAFDEAVMEGYEDLETDQDGLVPMIDNTLPAGTYQLREKASLSGYQDLPNYVEFSVSKTGMISLLPSMDGKSWIELRTSNGSSGSGVSDDPAAADGTLVYTMIIKNYIDASVTIKKVDQKGANLPGSKFQLCKYGTSWKVVDGYSEIDLTKVNSKKLTGLSVGRYRLEETQSPDGYVILIKYTYFNIAQNGTASLTDEEGTGSNSNQYASISGNTITVKNIPGAALPSAGGPGTGLLYLLGTMLMALAGAVFVLRRKRRDAA